MNTIRLAGCGTTPLGSYLKALGVLRLVGEQADPMVRGWWDGDRFMLSTGLTEHQVLDFFLDRYEPSPVVSPWNSDGGFSRSGKRTSERVLAAVTESPDPRLAPYQQAIAAVWTLVDHSMWASWDKREQVQACRNRLPDRALDWLDASVVLSGRADGKVDTPAILGTGGNLGRIELSSNFMQRLLEVLGTQTAVTRTIAPARRRDWLDKALFGRGHPTLVDGVVGQYSPGQASSGRVNPWDFVLVVEGALLFASGVARAATSERGSHAAMSFMVRGVAAGHDTPAPREDVKGEIWAPLWDRPTGLAELRRLFREGRLRRGRRDARTGLDAARAAATLGVDRGVQSFARYVLVTRFGQSTIAVPAGQLRVTERPEVSTLDGLDGWLNRVRGTGDLPAHIAAAVRAVEQAEFEVAARGEPGRLLRVLSAVAELHAAIGRSGRVRANVPPLTGLPAAEWLPRVAVPGVEFELAAAFASLRAADGESLRDLLTPVVRRPGKQWAWSDQSAAVAGFRTRSLADVLAEAHTVRSVRLSQQHRRGGGRRHERTTVPFSCGQPVVADTVAAFLADAVDLARLSEHLGALLLLDWRNRPSTTIDSGTGALPVDPLWRLLVPFYAHLPADRRAPAEPPDTAAEEVRGAQAHSPPGGPDSTVTLQPGPDWARLLQNRNVRGVAADAVRRLRAARMRPLVAANGLVTPEVDPMIVSAALLLRLPRSLTRAALRHCATRELPT